MGFCFFSGIRPAADHIQPRVDILLLPEMAMRYSFSPWLELELFPDPKPQFLQNPCSLHQKLVTQQRVQQILVIHIFHGQVTCSKPAKRVKSP